MIKQGDCLELMKEIPSGSVDMIATDPPYCVGATSNGSKSTFSDFNLMRPFFELCFAEFARILKGSAHVYICTDWRTYPFLYPILGRFLTVRNMIVWDYGWIKAGNFYRATHELIMFATKGKAVREFAASEADVWRIKCVNYTKERFHPAQKPVELFERMIKNSSAPGETVLDAFMGSGTAGVACLNLNRKFIGFELDEQIFQIAQKRLVDAELEISQKLFA